MIQPIAQYARRRVIDHRRPSTGARPFRLTGRYVFGDYCRHGVEHPARGALSGGAREHPQLTSFGEPRRDAHAVSERDDLPRAVTPVSATCGAWFTTGPSRPTRARSAPTSASGCDRRTAVDDARRHPRGRAGCPRARGGAAGIGFAVVRDRTANAARTSAGNVLWDCPGGRRRGRRGDTEAWRRACRRDLASALLRRRERVEQALGGVPVLPRPTPSG